MHREQEKLRNLIRKRKNVISRVDSNKFRERVILNDKTGKRITQEPIHKSWLEHIQYCKENNKHCAILAPWGHGKTVNVVIGESLWMIGHNPEIRIKIINSQDTYATDRIKVISNYIENSQEYRNIFPNVVRDENQQWTDHRIYVKRNSKAIDPTIEARGIMSKGVGGRADVLIFDDPVDDDSISSEKTRENVRNKYRNLWIPRLVDTGFIIYICTRYSDEDLTRTIIDSGRYSVLIQKISEDFSCIEQERI